MKNAYYRTCFHCGAHLDPGEACDCRQVNREPTREKTEKAARDATNIQSGGVRVKLPAPLSPSV